MIVKEIILDHGGSFAVRCGEPLVSGDVQAYQIVYKTPWNLTGVAVQISVKRMDGVVITDIGMTQDQTAHYTLKNNMYGVPGEAVMRLTLVTAEGTVLTTKEIYFDVVESFGEPDLGADDRLPALQNLIIQCENLAGLGEVVQEAIDELAKVPIAAGSGYRSLMVGSVTSASGETAYAQGYLTEATGDHSHAQGTETKAAGKSSHAEGEKTKATGRGSHAQGIGTVASGVWTHAQGQDAIASAQAAHAQGIGTEAMGEFSHAQGHYAKAKGYAAHAQGNGSISAAKYGHAQGSNSLCGVCSFVVKSVDAVGSKLVLDSVEGLQKGDVYSVSANGSVTLDKGSITAIDVATKTLTVTDVSGIVAKDKPLFGGGMFFILAKPKAGTIPVSDVEAAHAQGMNTNAHGSGSHAQGRGTTAFGHSAHAQGQNTKATGENSHAQGQGTKASGWTSHAQGMDTTATGRSAHAQGERTQATGEASHAQGRQTQASGLGSHAQGEETVASGTASHAQGRQTKAGGIYAHAQGDETAASGQTSHAQGYKTKASGRFSHAQGQNCEASADDAHAQGFYTKALAHHSHAQGKETKASGIGSHAQGNLSEARGHYAHAQGCGTVAAKYLEHAMGQYNSISTVGYEDYLNLSANALVIGNGNNEGTRSNAFRVTFDGRVYGGASFNASGADYGEYFEWVDSNEQDEDRVGFFVALEGEKIRKATGQDENVIGVVSGISSIVGNACEDHWIGMYEKDGFGRSVFEEVLIEAQTILDEDGREKIVVPAHTERRFKVNAAYDALQEYIPRSQRKEWAVVGMLGQLLVRDDGSCIPGSFAKISVEGSATHSETDTQFYVLSRVDDDIIKVLKT